MQTIYIVFETESDRVKGFFELALHSRIGSLPGQVYQIPMESLRLLDDIHVMYRRATDSEVKRSKKS